MARTPNFSLGIVLVDGTDPDWPDNKEHSFHVNGAGKIVELYGWSKHGSTKAADHIAPNGPQAENYTTVYLASGLTDKAEGAIGELLAEHRQLFGTGVVWVVPQVSGLAAWVRGGMGFQQEVEAEEEYDGADLWDTEGSPAADVPAEELEEIKAEAEEEE